MKTISNDFSIILSDKDIFTSGIYNGLTSTQAASINNSYPLKRTAENVLYYVNVLSRSVNINRFPYNFILNTYHQIFSSNLFLNQSFVLVPHLQSFSPDCQAILFSAQLIVELSVLHKRSIHVTIKFFRNVHRNRLEGNI